MEKAKLYHDIAMRTQGDIYIGVVGPVRTGKSTFIKRFMELVVLENIENAHARARVVDELPQSGGGRSVMTTQPRFVPNDAVRLSIGENEFCNVRLVDCVGYLVPGAKGYEEEGAPRMVRTPWFDEEIPFEEAAAVGTRKVISDHATVGIVMTTDGSITDLPRESYVEAEALAISETMATGKPFIVVVNTKDPGGERAERVRQEISERYGVQAVCLDALAMGEEQAKNLIENVLLAFPLRLIQIKTPAFLSALPKTHELVNRILLPVYCALPQLRSVRDYQYLLRELQHIESFEPARLESVELSTGTAVLSLLPEEGLFYQVLGEQCGCDISDDFELFSVLREYLSEKKRYDRVSGALAAARQTGYGQVPPAVDEMELIEPEIIQQGGRFGVRLRARASGLHVIRVDVESEVSPIVGTEQQSAALVSHLTDTFKNDPSAIWETEIFGKPLYDLVREGMQGKVGTMPDEVRMRIRETLERIVNEGCNGLICIML